VTTLLAVALVPAWLACAGGWAVVAAWAWAIALASDAIEEQHRG
jgi:hypothetical protein